VVNEDWGCGRDYGGDSWLKADGARAVGDGDCLGGSGSVGDAIEGQMSGLWADGGENLDGRGDPGLVGPGGDRCGEASNNGELCELHFD